MESVARLATGMSVSAIAFEFGYRNAGAFNTLFRKSMGETPQRYLRSSTSGGEE
ncbi:helix-turn-helix domain-containing protein [Caballeronia sp. LZ043]|uniref:helix-turn-helix domain-containing protein n=1 Tax=Caballeronia sp. LZ043 TaxID=3038569 RepID=UPI00385771B4